MHETTSMAVYVKTYQDRGGRERLRMLKHLLKVFPIGHLQISSAHLTDHGDRIVDNATLFEHLLTREKFDIHNVIP